MESRLKAEYSTIELATLIKKKIGCVYPIAIKTNNKKQSKKKKTIKIKRLNRKKKK